MTDDQHLVATCGMNCGLCIAYQRERKPCSGCNGPDENKPRHCVVCSIRNCDELKTNGSNFCFVCRKFPCSRLKQLDKRYRTKYGMSMVENLNSIRQYGLDKFVTIENKKWECPECGSLLSVHSESCITCGNINKYFPGFSKK